MGAALLLEQRTHHGQEYLNAPSERPTNVLDLDGNVPPPLPSHTGEVEQAMGIALHDMMAVVVRPMYRPGANEAKAALSDRIDAMVAARAVTEAKKAAHYKEVSLVLRTKLDHFLVGELLSWGL
jgi:hypothetical protein